MTNLVQFPALGLSFTLNRVAFSIGGINIYWYGVCIAVGMCLALVFAFRHGVEFGVDADAMVDVILIGVVMGILCARLYYVAMSPYNYSSLWDVLAIRDGGLAIYGGVIGGFLFGGLACKWRRVPVLPMFDLAAMGFLIGQGCGRWGNFFNQEAFGCNTTLPWGMYSEATRDYLLSSVVTAPKGTVIDPNLPVHPTFLYESIWCFVGLFLLVKYIKKRKFAGDIALRYLEPQDYQHIADKLAETESERRAFIARFLEPITQRLDQAGLRYHVKSRTKSIFSIWNKMRKQHVPFEGVYDIFAIRIILDCPLEEEKQQCWTVYSIVTDFYTPNPERMRDWISIPKSNGYESLHTTVATKEGRWVEIQIRTERMDAVAERGIAAHWRYKGVNAGSDGSEMWMKQLRELMEDKTRPLAQNFDAKPSSGEIFVFTPGGDLRKLPEGATVLDFAFDIHTSLGLTCSGGKVNNRPAAIRDVLHNGDIVEVLTQKNQKPKADWLGFVTTSKARTRIKASLREEHTKNARLGREELERKLKNWKLPLTVDEGVGILCKHFKLRTGTELYASIGTEKIDLMQIKELLQAHLSGEAEEERRAAAAAIESEKRRKAEKVSTQSSGDALIIDEKIGQLDYKLAKCCNPIHGDEIFGFITVGAGITIHRTDCPNAQRLRRNYPYRVLEARWRDEAQGAFRVSIRVVASDTTGMINHIAEVINRDLKLSIRSMNLSPGGGLLSGVIHVEVPGTGMVDMLIHSILRIKGVQKAYRVNN